MRTSQAAGFYSALDCPDMRGSGSPATSSLWGEYRSLCPSSKPMGRHSPLDLVCLEGSSSDMTIFTTRPSIGLLLGAFLPPLLVLLACLVSFCPFGDMLSTRAKRPAPSGSSCCPGFYRVQHSWEEAAALLCWGQRGSSWWE